MPPERTNGFVFGFFRRNPGVDRVGLGVFRSDAERSEHGPFGEVHTGHDRGVVRDPNAGVDDRYRGRDLPPLHDVVGMAVHISEVRNRDAVAQAYTSTDRSDGAFEICEPDAFEPDCAELILRDGFESGNN